MSDTAGLHALTGQIEKLADNKTTVSVEAVWNQIGKRSFGAILLAPSLVALTPAGGIPTLPTILALIVLLISAQILFGRKQLWLPAFLLRRSVSSKRLKQSLGYVQPVTRRVDKAIQPRLMVLTSQNFGYVIAIICVLLALAIPPLEPFPFAGTPIWVAFALFGLALVAHDGVLVILGLLTSLASLFVLWWFLF